jgi:hypothetical protein
MTESRKQPSQPAQGDQAQRQQFEAELQQARQQLASGAAPGGTPAGAQAMPSLGKIWTLLNKALTDSHIVEWLWSKWQEAHPTPQPPAPPPEPAS